MTTDKLVEKAKDEIAHLCGSKLPRKDWRMSIPVDAMNDSDVLFAEVVKRLEAYQRERERLRYRVVEYAAMKQYLETTHKSYYPHKSRPWNGIDEDERQRHRDSVREIVLTHPVFGERAALKEGGQGE